MAYAALLSLSHTLDRIFIRDQYPHILEKEKLVALQENVSILLAFLEDYSSRYRGAVNALENRVIDAAFRVEDVIESQLVARRPSAFKRMMFRFQSSNPNLEIERVQFQKALQEMSFIVDEVMKFQNGDQVERISPPDEFTTSVSSSLVARSEANNTVGLNDVFMAIKNMMYQESSSFQVIPIFGMGGIGKTTLAARLYEDSDRMQKFERRIWIVVSQDYSLRKILLGILQSIQKLVNEKCSDGELRNIVHRELFGRSYLVVADDVWSEEAWDVLYRVLPKGTKGRQVVLVTTRSQKLAAYAGTASGLPHEIQFLSEDQSWILLKERALESRSYPSELEQVGKEIAKCCRGLPLMIVVVAGLLRKNKTHEYWSSTLHNIHSSARSDIMAHCSKVLSLSYDHLPLYLKPCFLYVTAFPEDYEVNVKRLVRLWMAEGFVRPTGSKCLEEVAYGYLDDLVGRSLLIVSRKKHGKAKAVKIHDTLRDIGKLKAQHERFHYHDDSASWDGNQRRVTSADISSHGLSKFQNPTTRSVLMPHSVYGRRRFSFKNHTLLRVLDTCHELPKANPEKLVLLRYLAIECSKHAFSRLAYVHYTFLMKSVCKLRNIQTLVIEGPKSSLRLCLPLKVWKMPFLRQVIFLGNCYFVMPTELELVKETDLQTLTNARDLKITAQAIIVFANLRKLSLHYSNAGGWKNSNLSNLVRLEKLEELKISRVGTWTSGIRSVGLALPHSLKKLYFDQVLVPWKDMDIVGSLPRLEKLKLRYTSTDAEWKPVEGQFLKLKYLKLERVHLQKWEVESRHFPSLRILVLDKMGEKLKEIPDEIGEIDALETIELYDCQPSLVASANQIKATQEDETGGNLQVRVFESQNFTSWI